MNQNPYAPPKSLLGNMEPFLNWKIIVIHALLLLIAGIASGIFQLHPTSLAPNVFLSTYLLNHSVIVLVYIAIFTHITYRAENLPFAHALLALLLSNEAASTLYVFLLSYLGEKPKPFDPLPFLVFEYISFLVALLVGAKVGISLRRRKLLRSKGSSASTNA